LYRRLGLTDKTMARARDVFTQAMQGGKRLTRKEMYAALTEAGIDATETRGPHLLGYWARRGLICWGPRRGKQPTFTLLDEWLPGGRQLTGDEALAELAKRYFTSHGPATVRDLAWWSGLNLTEAKSAIEAAGRELVQETVEDRAYWSGRRLPSPRPSPDVYLPPAYDEFDGSPRRPQRLLDPAVLQQVQYGIGRSSSSTGGWPQRLEANNSKKDRAARNKPLVVILQKAVCCYGQALPGTLRSIPGRSRQHKHFNPTRAAVARGRSDRRQALPPSRRLNSASAPHDMRPNTSATISPKSFFDKENTMVDVD
jgi:hypothetical protein